MSYEATLWLLRDVLSTALCGVILAIVVDGFLRDRKERAR